MASNRKASGQSVNEEIFDGDSEEGSGRAMGPRYAEPVTGRGAGVAIYVLLRERSGNRSSHELRIFEGAEMRQGWNRFNHGIGEILGDGPAEHCGNGLLDTKGNGDRTTH